MSTPKPFLWWKTPVNESWHKQGFLLIEFPYINGMFFKNPSYEKCFVCVCVFFYFYLSTVCHKCVWWTHHTRVCINQTKSPLTAQWCQSSVVINNLVPKELVVSRGPSQTWSPCSRTAKADQSYSWIMHTLSQDLIGKWIPDQYWPVDLGRGGGNNN